MSNQFIKALPLVASALGRKYGVRVIIGAEKAASDGRDIFLPALPMDSPPELVSLARGYLDHEAAHIRETDFSLLKKSGLNPLEKHIWNMIEDYRVEKALGEAYPGCRENFQWLIRKFFDADQTDDDEAAEAAEAAPDLDILNWMLLTLRSWAVPELQTRVEVLAESLSSSAPGLTDKIQPVLEEIKLNRLGPDMSIAYARRIVQLLADLDNLADLDKSDNRDNRDKEPDGQEESGSDNSLDKEAGWSADDRETGQDAEQPASPVGGSACGSEEESLKTARTVKSLLARTNGELPSSFDKTLEEALNAARSKSGDKLLSVAELVPGILPPLPPSSLQKAKKATLGLAGQLQNLLQGAVLKRDNPGLSGRLNTNGLHRLYAGNPRVFRKNCLRTGLNTAVHLLIDVSGSMLDKISLVSQIAYSVCKALSGIPGVNLGATVFPGVPVKNAGHPQGNLITVTSILKHGQPFHKNFRLDAHGSTPMGEAVWWVLQEMALLRESRKIVFILTDGEPDSPANAEIALNEARRSGLEMYGLGLGCDAVMRLMPGRSVVIDKLSDLPRCLYRLLGQVISRTV
jgi:cobalamin biosynthesis protein CobT